MLKLYPNLWTNHNEMHRYLAMSLLQMPSHMEQSMRGLCWTMFVIISSHDHVFPYIYINLFSCFLFLSHLFLLPWHWGVSAVAYHSCSTLTYDHVVSVSCSRYRMISCLFLLSWYWGSRSHVLDLALTGYGPLNWLIKTQQFFRVLSNLCTSFFSISHHS